MRVRTIRKEDKKEITKILLEMQELHKNGRKDIGSIINVGVVKTLQHFL